MTNVLSSGNSDPFAQLDSIKNLPPASPQMQNQHIQKMEFNNPQDFLLIGQKQDRIDQIVESFNYIPDIPFENNNYQPQKRASQIRNDFPQKPKMTLLIPETFSNYNVDTLFYIFFYFPGTPQQYFAGKELQELGWIFYSEAMTWIHINGEPSQKTATFQKANIDFFDKERWEIVTKNNFQINLPKK